MQSQALLDLLRGSASPPNSRKQASNLDLLFADLNVNHPASAQHIPVSTVIPSRRNSADSAALLNLLQNMPEPKAAESQGQPSVLLDQLFGTTAAPKTPSIQSEPASVIPSTSFAETSNESASDQKASTAAASSLVQKTASPFDFVSPFDILAKSSAQIDKLQETYTPKQSVPTTALEVLPDRRPSTTSSKKDSSKRQPSRASKAKPAAQPHSASACGSSEESPVPRSPVEAAKPVTILQRPANFASSSTNSAKADSSPGIDDATSTKKLQDAHFLAINLVDKSTNSCFGHAFPFSNESMQNIKLDIGKPLPEYTCTDDLTSTPITIYSSTYSFNLGSRIALLDQHIMVYSTQQGRLRVLDRSTGARLLLKNHAGPILDFVVRGISATEFQIISSGSDGRLLLWRISRRIPDSSLYDLDHYLFAQLHNQDSLKVVKIITHPREIGWNLIIYSDGSAAMIHTQDVPKGFNNSISSVTHQTIGRKSICDAAFSKSGLTLLTLDNDGAIEIFALNTGESLLCFNQTARRLDTAIASSCQILLAEDDDGNAVIVIASRNGNKLSLISLDGQPLGSVSFEQGLANSFGKILYDSSTSLLLMSNSCRGSILAFYVDMTESKSSQETVDEVLQVATHGVSSERSYFVAAVEWSTPKQLIEICPAMDETLPSIFCLAPDGVSQLALTTALPKFREIVEVARESRPESKGVPDLQTNLATLDRADSPVSTNVSNQIKVDVETAVATDHESATASPRPMHKRLPSLKSSLASPLSATDVRFQALESSLISKLSDAVNAAFNRHHTHSLPEEDLDKRISTIFAQQATAVLESSFRAEINGTLLPNLKRLIEQQIHDDISKALKNSVQKAIPEALGSFFNRGDVTNHLIKTFSAGAEPIIERTVHQAILPIFARATGDFTEKISRELRQEVLGVRKEIVAEQSSILSTIVEDIRLLKQAILPPSTLPSRSSHSYRQQSDHPYPSEAPAGQFHQEMQQRPVTPVENYEDVLLDILSVRDPGSTALSSYISDGPSYRFERIFVGAHGRPVVSQTVLLALSHKLVADMNSHSGPLQPTESARLNWLVACFQSFDQNDPTSAYIPRVVAACTNCLINLQSRLLQVRDMNGLSLCQNALRIVENTDLYRKQNPLETSLAMYANGFDHMNLAIPPSTADISNSMGFARGIAAIHDAPSVVPDT